MNILGGGLKLDKELNYLKEAEKAFTPLLAIEEAARCLLCHDAPCSKACPAGTDPAKFIRSLRFRNLKGAVETIRENNPFGAVCARVCPYGNYCEGACSRTGIDEPIKIGKLQSFLTDYEASIGMKVLEKGEEKAQKVAVIGAGPAGLSAASKLATLGYKVTVFEKSEKAGGWLTYGIPPTRLPQAVVDKDIEYIKDLGVEIRTNCNVGCDLTIEDLKKEGYSAFLFAVGMQKGKAVNIKGKELLGVVNGVDFLREAKDKKGNIEVPNKVIVIGGGDVAMDCAATCKLLGAEDVKIVYRRSLDKMPAQIEERSYVQSLNIPIFTGIKPEEIIGEDKVTHFKGVGMFDDSEIVLPCDMVIFAIGQEMDEVADVEKLNLAKDGLIKVEGFKTEAEGVFACGDAIEGEKTVVYAVKLGKEAAKEVDLYLSSRREGCEYAAAGKEGAK